MHNIQGGAVLVEGSGSKANFSYCNFVSNHAHAEIGDAVSSFVVVVAIREGWRDTNIFS